MAEYFTLVRSIPFCAAMKVGDDWWLQQKMPGIIVPRRLCLNTSCAYYSWEN